MMFNENKPHFSSYLGFSQHRCSCCLQGSGRAQKPYHSARCLCCSWQHNNTRCSRALCHNVESNLMSAATGSPCGESADTRYSKHQCPLYSHSAQSVAPPNMLACPPESSGAKVWVWILELAHRSKTSVRIIQVQHYLKKCTDAF